MTLFFVAGLHREAAFLTDETADASRHAWDDDLLDVVGFAAVRTTLLFVRREHSCV